MRVLIKQFALFLVIFKSFAQEQLEVNPPDFIKSIVFVGPTQDQFPIIQLGESINLTFDDLTASEQDYYYKITHCDYDWTPSQLLKSQYLNGADNQRIINYENSYNTLQPYSNYTLTLPNDEVSFKVSGNYMLEIYNSTGDIQFSRRFLIYENKAAVSATVKRSRDFNYLNTKQVIQFTINTSNVKVVNPKEQIKTNIIQNYQWNTSINTLKPQFTLGNELVYKYDQEASFYGGNEYLNFDTKDLRSPTFAISRIEYTDVYHHYLFANQLRKDQKYTYFPDINGDFQIRTLQGSDVSREAEYTLVHFKLPYTAELGLNSIYVTGKFNNYDLTEENKMAYNEETGYFELAYPFKQGFYNYKYVMVKEDGSVEPNFISGDFHFTENNYLILVYFRNFGDVYDSLIGIGNTNSETITN
ncbi:DUF5103 domain-containing protein [Croceivirga radicis]|uniref:DUF5103 domain-containing protein n=1 Tax=Croceivirga radicis TaxID=1929488 RepID=A0A1V6LUT2_9FLAO|nr:DUF5103 domain-containing protein [Croceivirga radicis]OQD43934.1 DUF5103 domain-containing protein [Croceivirga radicis]